MPPSKLLTLMVPGSLDARTGGYGYDRRIAAGLRVRGWTVDVREIDASFPRPSPAALDEAARVLAGIEDGGVVMIDGLAYGAMPSQAERESRRLRMVALVHLPLAADVGVDASTAAALEAGERHALRSAALVVVTGSAAAGMLESYGVTPDRIALVEPGTDPAPLAHGSGSTDTVQLLSVGTINPGKGHEILLNALSMIPERNWRLTCAGSLSRHPETVARVRQLLRDKRLDDRVTLAGELDEAALSACYDSADVFVLATLRETYGMAVAEALARGLPVVSTRTGEIPALAADNAGLLVEPGDVDALAGALSCVLRDARLRARLRDGATRARERLRTWDQAGDEMAAALASVTPNV